MSSASQWTAQTYASKYFGPSGPRGQFGVKGKVGPTGPTGPSGPSSSGVVGERGYTGPSGPTGPTGPTGGANFPIIRTASSSITLSDYASYTTFVVSSATLTISNETLGISRIYFIRPSFDTPTLTINYGTTRAILHSITSGTRDSGDLLISVLDGSGVNFY